MSQDLSVDGPYSPVSLRKVIDTIPESNEFTVIIPDNVGIDIDNAETINITIEERVIQSHYFIDEVFPELPRIPAYLYRYIHYMMEDDYKMKYPTDKDYIEALDNGTLKISDDEYQKIYGFIKWGKSNTEATHLIGLVQLVAGTLKMASKAKKFCKFFIELPETGFHPKRQSRIMSLLHKLKDEYHES